MIAFNAALNLWVIHSCDCFFPFCIGLLMCKNKTAKLQMSHNVKNIYINNEVKIISIFSHNGGACYSMEPSHLILIIHRHKWSSVAPKKKKESINILSVFCNTHLIAAHSSHHSAWMNRTRWRELMQLCPPLQLCIEILSTADRWQI